MTSFEHSIEIEAPVEDVFEFSTDPSNWTRTNPSLTEVEIIEETDDSIRLELTYRMLGISMDVESEMEIVEPNAHTVSTFEGDDMSGELHWYYEETDDGTEVTVEADYEFGDSLLNRVIKPVAVRYNERQFRQSLQNMKDLIEAELEVEAAVEA